MKEDRWWVDGGLGHAIPAVCLDGPPAAFFCLGNSFSRSCAGLYVRCAG